MCAIIRDAGEHQRSSSQVKVALVEKLQKRISVLGEDGVFIMCQC